MSIKNTFFGIAVFSIILILSAHKAYAGLDKKHNAPSLVYWHGDITQPKISLTFDDGPNEPYTSEILDILKKYNVQATFFVLGKNVERYPEIAKRIVQEGHVIGNHTYDHPFLLIQSKSHIKYEIEKAEQAIFKATRTKSYLFRPPYGVTDNWIYHIVQEHGYVTVEWSVTGNNGGKEIRTDAIEKDVLSKVTNGVIILLHDGDRLIKGADRRNIVKALPIIIESLRKKGYQFVTVPELLGIKNIDQAKSLPMETPQNRAKSSNRANRANRGIEGRNRGTESSESRRIEGRSLRGHPSLIEVAVL